MQFFTKEEFISEHPEYKDIITDNSTWLIKASSEMIFSQVGLRYRDTSWNSDSVPSSVKEASMEQLRFMLEHDIPFIDYDKTIEARKMKANLKSDYSTLALRILSNGGYLYRGSRMTDNMALNIPFGS